MKKAFAFTAIILLALSSLSCEGPAGPPGDPTGSLSDPSIMPRVVYTYPGAGTTGPFPELYRNDCNWEWCYSYSQLQVRFNKYMDVTSVRRAVRFTSPDGNFRADTNFILSVGGDVFILNPVDSNGYRTNYRFTVGAEYSIEVGTTARDINGNPLLPPFTATFVPEPNFRVMSISPGNGETGVPVYLNVGLQFNSRVSAAILPHLSISPSVGGSWLLGYDSTFAQFTPSATLPTATEFTVGVDAFAEDVRGNRIAAPFTSRFTTVPFRVSSTYPSDGATGLTLSTSASVYFSVPFDTSTARAAFGIVPSTPGTIFGITPGSATLNFSPSNGFLGATRYTVRIDSTLRDMTGDHLPGRYEFSFTTAPFSVTSTMPANGVSGVSRSAIIYIYTNAPLDQSTVARSIQLSPAAVTYLSACDGCSSFHLSTAGLAANTTYTVTIGSGLRTKRGEPLPAPYTFSFTTGPN